MIDEWSGLKVIAEQKKEVLLNNIFASFAGFF